MRRPRKLQQAFQKTVHPNLRQISGQGERQESGDRLASHGRDIAESSREAAMADDFRRMPLPAEVNTFQAEVGRDQGFVTGRDSEDGTVVADSGNYTGV